MSPGETLAILKYESSRSDAAYDIDGDRYATPDRRDEAASLYVEYGAGPDLTLQAKVAWTRGADSAGRYEGRGPIEVGVRHLVYRSSRSAVSLYAGAVISGAGRNAGYDPPGVGKTDFEVRLLAGRSAPVFERPAFAELQLARLTRAGLPDETRLDLTAGVEPTTNWLLLGQAYAGRTDAAPAWVKVEVSAARRFGDWRIQAGWRASVAGRSGPEEAGPVMAIWRSF